jgi:hypothetical protein
MNGKPSNQAVPDNSRRSPPLRLPGLLWSQVNLKDN